MKIDTFANRLKKALEIRNTKQIELAQKTGLGKSAISQYLNGKYEPKQTAVYKIAQALNINEAWLLGYETQMEKEEFTGNKVLNLYNSLNQKNKKESINYMTYLKSKQDNNIELAEEIEPYTVPLLGKTAAGPPIANGDPIYDKTVSAVPRGADFALIVDGDSMEPLIRDNSIVYIRKQCDVENGEIVAITINGETTCKKIYKENGKIRLVSINKKYDDMIYEKGDIRIEGKVIL